MYLFIPSMFTFAAIANCLLSATLLKFKKIKGENTAGFKDDYNPSQADLDIHSHQLNENNDA